MNVYMYNVVYIPQKVSEQNLSGIGFVKTVYLLLNIDVLNYYCIKLVDIVYYIYTIVFVFQLNVTIMHNLHNI